MWRRRNKEHDNLPILRELPALESMASFCGLLIFDVSQLHFWWIEFGLVGQDPDPPDSRHICDPI